MPSVHHVGLSTSAFGACVISPARTAGHTRCCITFSANRDQTAALSSSSFAAVADIDADADADARRRASERPSSLQKIRSLLVGGKALTVAGDKDGDFRYTSRPMMHGGHLPMVPTHIVT